MNIVGRHIKRDLRSILFGASSKIKKRFLREFFDFDEIIKKNMFECPFCGATFIATDKWDLSVKAMVHLGVYHPDEYKVIQEGQQRVNECKRDSYTAGRTETSGAIIG